ncbi:MAG TPA: hypothetical protein VIQ00_11210 [Chitinophagaceae bacterium]|jgi:hypothetical protein
MKNLLRFLSAAFIISATIFSCAPDHNSLASASIADVLTKSNWSVQVISDDPAATHDFLGNTLSFDERGAALLKRNDNSLLGKWNSTNDVINLQITGTDASVQQINKHWKVSSKSSTSVTFNCNEPQSDCRMILTKK